MSLRCTLFGHERAVVTELNAERREIEYLECERCGDRVKNREGPIHPVE